MHEQRLKSSEQFKIDFTSKENLSIFLLPVLMVEIVGDILRIFCTRKIATNVKQENEKFLLFRLPNRCWI